ncbi:MAG TPA: cyanophycin synthetase [Candidatus Paceibacterota bacterium]|nr:cyanophycin synthetase [Candidatus Paceibacterota bacterium]
MKKKNQPGTLGNILKKIAPQIEARVFLGPEWKMAGQVIFKNGKVSYFKFNTLDLNPVGASEIAKDKDFANLFMEKLGYSIVPGSKTFFSNEWADAIGSADRRIDDAYLYAKSIGFPLVIKPNSGSQGRDVLIVQNKREFYRGLRVIFKSDRIALVQKPVSGKEYRIVVLDEEMVLAHERLPLSVVGDGKMTIAELIEAKQKSFDDSGRHVRIKPADPRIHTKLTREGKTFLSVPSQGEHVFLLDNANLSDGGDAVDVTDRVHPDFKNLAVKLTKDMGLRFCGVDIMIHGDISEAAEKYWILEINASPGLDHYMHSGKNRKKKVEELYLKIIKKLEQ